jgi:6-phosphogluconolactonase (cycloisomerase 2 family)
MSSTKSNSPSFLAVHDKKEVYAVNEEKPNGSLSVFELIQDKLVFFKT